ncbi:unnamed protein product [Discosporangium mesarthrocarpum]
MGKGKGSRQVKGGGQRSQKGGGGRGGSSSGAGAGFAIWEVDPRRIRFAHSKIKPVFSGCGRTIEKTLEEIRTGKTSPSDLPLITVIHDPADTSSGEPWFFSLNNRRLYVLKVCQEEGLLGPLGLVPVRVRGMKAHERERYTVEKCSLTAKFIYTLTRKDSDPPPSDTARGENEAKVEEGTMELGEFS